MKKALLIAVLFTSASSFAHAHKGKKHMGDGANQSQHQHEMGGEHNKDSKMQNN